MAAKKTQLQMWQEFGAWLRAEDVAAWAGKATGAKEAVAKTSTKRASDLIAKYGPKKKIDGSEGPKTPTKKVDGSEGPKMGAKPPVRTTTKPVYDSIRRTPVTSPKPSMIGNRGGNGSMNKPNGSINKPNGSINKPNGVINKPDGSMNKPKGSINKPKGVINKPKR